MAYFEMTLINGTERATFDISVNEGLYYYLIAHNRANPMADDWFTLTLDPIDVIIIKQLCSSKDENEKIAKKIENGTIFDILVHRTILIQGDD